MAKKVDTTDIEDETKIIFESYVENSLEQDRNNNIIDPGTPSVKIEKLPSIDNEKCFSIAKELFELSKSIELQDNNQMLQILNLFNLDDRSKGAFQDFTSVAVRRSQSFGKDLAEMSTNRKFDNNSAMNLMVTVILRPTGSYNQQSLNNYKLLLERALFKHISLDSILFFFRVGYLIARGRLIQGEFYIIHEVYRAIEDVFKRLLVFHWIRDKGGWNTLLSQSSSNRRYLLIGGSVAIVAILGILLLRYRRSWNF